MIVHCLLDVSVRDVVVFVRIVIVSVGDDVGFVEIEIVSVGDGLLGVGCI